MTEATGRQAALHGLAERLAEAWRAAGRIDRVADHERPRDRVEAYAVQDRMAELLGEPLVGWKVGATSPKMRELDGHDDVIPGRIWKQTCYFGSELTLPSERFADARIETEFAFRLDADLPLRDQPWRAAELREKITLLPALELIGHRYPVGFNPATLDTVADNGGGIGFVFGEPIDRWRELRLDFANQPIILTVDDAGPAENFLGELRCRPVEALADCVNQLAGRGIALRRGEYVSTGAATVPQPLAAGCRVRADFGPLGVIALRFAP